MSAWVVSLIFKKLNKVSFFRKLKISVFVFEFKVRTYLQLITTNK